MLSKAGADANDGLAVLLVAALAGLAIVVLATAGRFRRWRVRRCCPRLYCDLDDRDGARVRAVVGGHERARRRARTSRIAPPLGAASASTPPATPITAAIVDADAIATFCHYVHFFADRAAAEQWTGEHDGTFVISLADGAEIARLANAARSPTIR